MNELLYFYENGFARIFADGKNEIQFLNNVQAAADKINKPDISLRLVFGLLGHLRLFLDRS